MTCADDPRIDTIYNGLYAVVECPCHGENPDCSCAGKAKRTIITNIELEYLGDRKWQEKGPVPKDVL